MSRSRREPRLAPAHAETDGEDGRGAAVAQRFYPGGHVGLDALRRRERDVLHVFELVVPLGDARRATEVVDGNCRVTALRKAQGQLFVEAIEAANVREDDDANVRALLGRREERGEAIAVGGLELEIFV